MCIFPHTHITLTCTYYGLARAGLVVLGILLLVHVLYYMGFMMANVDNTYTDLNRVNRRLGSVSLLIFAYVRSLLCMLTRLSIAELHIIILKCSPLLILYCSLVLSENDPGEISWQCYFEDSPISRVFMGQLKSTLTCDVCEESSVTFDPFWDLSVPIPKVLYIQWYNFYTCMYGKCDLMY